MSLMRMKSMVGCLAVLKDRSVLVSFFHKAVL